MIRFSNKTIDEIKKRLPISEVMRNYAQIEHRGGKNWVKCPFHGGGHEKTASCILDDSNGRYYCFGCHASGDIFKLTQEKEGLDFASAVAELARRAGVQIEESTSLKDKNDLDEKNMLYDVYSRLSKTFNYILKNSPDAEDARSYLRKRNVSNDMIDTFQLGYAPKDKNWLYKFLQGKDYSNDFLKKSGLFSQNYEKLSLFTDRLMFPIRDRNGRVLAFSGRDLSGISRAKYINSPETRIYQKKENFFGLYEARKTIASGEIQPILCEGNFDVVAMHQAGYTSAIASLGTAFTTEQCDSIIRWYAKVKEFNLLFDSDDAGQNETVKAIHLVHSRGLEVFVHRFSTAKDASELLERDGKSGIDREFEPKTSGFDYLVQMARNRYDITNAKGKSDFLKFLSEFILTTTSSAERDSYILQVASILATSETSIKRDLDSLSKRTAKTSYSQEDEEDQSEYFGKPKETYDLFAVLFLANHMEEFKNYRNKLLLNDLSDSEAREIYMALENAMRNDIDNPELFLSTITDNKIKNDVAVSFADIDEKYKITNIAALNEAIMRIKIRSLEKQRITITNQLKLLPGTAEPSDFIELLEKKKELDDSIRKAEEELLRNSIKEA